MNLIRNKQLVYNARDLENKYLPFIAKKYVV